MRNKPIRYSPPRIPCSSSLELVADTLTFSLSHSHVPFKIHLPSKQQQPSAMVMQRRQVNVSIPFFFRRLHLSTSTMFVWRSTGKHSPADARHKMHFNHIPLPQIPCHVRQTDWLSVAAFWWRFLNFPTTTGKLTHHCISPFKYDCQLRSRGLSQLSRRAGGRRLIL